MSSRTVFMLAVALLLVVPGFALAATAACPAAVKDAALKAYPSAKVTACKEEKEKGKVQYEVKLETKEAKKLELDISPEGTLLLTEEPAALASLPTAVTAAFAAKYPKMKAASADKQTKPDGTVTYEMAWKDAKGKRHEATFKDDGTFVEEE
ncbi:MAG TPA: PepSY-like domain-containing protein [Thermoanaerobaculia bacterium]|nr:PepSY-like domain-containing protein [Thermoanaerobaculia bacterium]